MPVIDLSFVLVGATIPLDHGYSLFSSICRIVPALHGDRRIGIHPIMGRQSAPGVLSRTDHFRLKLRLPSEEIAPFIAIAGRELDLEGHRLRVGIPQVEALTPAANLASRLVTFRNALTPEAVQEDVKRELVRLEIRATPHLVPATRTQWEGQALRRVIRIKDRRVVGYAVRVTGLNPEESLRLLEVGLGGRRRMGCGLFAPWRAWPELSKKRLNVDDD